MGYGLLAFAFAAALSLSSKANASRECGNGTTTLPPAYEFALGDMRYDSPSLNDEQIATIAISLTQQGQAAWECVSQWPQSWAGWYEGGNNIIWTACVATGATAVQDDTVSFATDWNNLTMYLTNTFSCADIPGSPERLATGSVHLEFNCTTTNGSTSCIPDGTTNTTRPTTYMETTLTPAPLDSSTVCADNSDRYQSWQLQNWQRQYEIPPGPLTPSSDISNFATPLAVDTGPSFTLSSMSNTDVFNCTTSSGNNATYEGACESTVADNLTTTANFTFDPNTDLLTVTQTWNCSGGYVSLTFEMLNTRKGGSNRRLLTSY